MSTKASNKDPREIARELGVRYLLEGSVRRSEHRVRINAQLVEAARGVQVWAERYDRNLEDIFALQDDVTSRIIDGLEIHLSDTESRTLIRADRVNVAAHDLLLCGLEKFWEFTAESMEAAQRFFIKALDVDPSYATAHAWLGRIYLYKFGVLLIDRPELRELGFHHAKRAIDLNPRLPLGYSILGWAHFWREESAEALKPSRRAVEMDPNNPDAHFFLSLILCKNGRGDEGADCAQKAIRLSPHPPPVYLFALGINRFIQARYEDAVVAFKRGVVLAPSFIANAQLLVATYGLLGRLAEAAPYRDAWRGDRDVQWQRSLFFDAENVQHIVSGLERVGILEPPPPSRKR